LKVSPSLTHIHGRLTAEENLMHRFVRVVALASLWAMPAGSLFGQNQNGPSIQPNVDPQFQPTPTQPSQTQQFQPQPTPATRAFLGVHVAQNFPGSRNFQPGNANPQQGVVVQQVAPDSPAEKAGIKVGDTLTAFGDQKLVAAAQLIQLVRAEQPKHQVTIELLRDGKPQKMQITLGEVPVGPRDFMPPTGPMGRPFGRGPTTGPWNFGQDMSAVWQSFDSLSLRKTGDNKFRAEVQYVEKDAKTNKAEPKKHTFEGTPDDIHRAIEQTKDLTPPERFQLHRMLQFPGLEPGMRSPNMRPGVGALSPPNPSLDETPPK
jgi:membrane-associated protease RseP (regulator of RpoE activity)